MGRVFAKNDGYAPGAHSIERCHHQRAFQVLRGAFIGPEYCVPLPAGQAGLSGIFR
jgi:hypothetical protein